MSTGQGDTVSGDPTQPPHQEFVLNVVAEHAQFVRQVSDHHMKWLAFHVAVNVALLALLADRAKGIDHNLFCVFAVAAVLWNLLAALGCELVARYYQSVASDLKAADRALPAVQGVLFSSVLPERSWVWIARLIAGVCVILAVAWVSAMVIVARTTPVAEQAVPGTSGGVGSDGGAR